MLLCMYSMYVYTYLHTSLPSLTVDVTDQVNSCPYNLPCLSISIPDPVAHDMFMRARCLEAAFWGDLGDCIYLA